MTSTRPCCSDFPWITQNCTPRTSLSSPKPSPHGPRQSQHVQPLDPLNTLPQPSHMRLSHWNECTLLLKHCNCLLPQHTPQASRTLNHEFQPQTSLSYQVTASLMGTVSTQARNASAEKLATKNLPLITCHTLEHLTKAWTTSPLDNQGLIL